MKHDKNASETAILENVVFFVTYTDQQLRK